MEKELTPHQRHITQEGGTETPFDNAYWDNKEEGIYVDIISGEPLFSSTDKFDSGTGWPSFSQPINEEHIATKKDFSHFMMRTEVRSQGGQCHLGHVFNDGPGPHKKRFCINSASLRFVPKDRMEEEGYAKYLYVFEE